MRYDEADLLNVSNGMATFASPRLFDRLEGFGRWEFNGMSQTAGWRRSTGELAFAAAAGVVTLDPARLTRSAFTAPVQIERVLSNEKEVPARGPIELPPGQNQLEFHYTALSLAVPSRVAFRYRLEGIDSDWIDAGTRRVAYYANVPGGTYRFHVIAANHDGVWGQGGAVLAVSVGKHFYETIWFYTFGGVIALASLAGLSRWRVRRLQARERMLARLVEERTSALAEEVGERRRIERSLRQAKDVLEDRVRERTNELAVAYAKLQHDVAERRRLEEQLSQVQKLESIGRLAGGVAHDLNNVLTVVLSYADLLDAGLGAKHPLQEQLRQIRRAAERASNLTHRLLAFARQQVVEPRVVNLSELTLSLDGMLRRLIGEDIELVTITSSGLWSVKTDPHQIEQILVNLVVNARDAMPQGGKLTVETHNTVVDDVELRKQPTLKTGEYVLLTVTDTGTGMNAYVKQHLFEPFFTTKEQGKGTGLGLATCYGIVQQLGGHIVVDSDEGHGSTFRVYLPKVDLPAQPMTRTEESPQVPRGSETVLLVEDEDNIREPAVEILESRGYDVLAAHDAAQALAVAEEHAGPIHILVTDVVMPGMSGSQLAGQLTQRLPGLRVLYISGYPEDSISHHGVLNPEQHFLQKPFPPGQFLEKVREVLDGRAGAAVGK
jgi:signal transduction histidine kinase